MLSTNLLGILVNTLKFIGDSINYPFIFSGIQITHKFSRDSNNYPQIYQGQRFQEMPTNLLGIPVATQEFVTDFSCYPRICQGLRQLLLATNVFGFPVKTQMMRGSCRLSLAAHLNRLHPRVPFWLFFSRKMIMLSFGLWDGFFPRSPRGCSGSRPWPCSSARCRRRTRSRQRSGAAARARPFEGKDLYVAFQTSSFRSE